MTNFSTVKITAAANRFQSSFRWNHPKKPPSKPTWFGSISFSTHTITLNVSFPTSSESIQISNDDEIEDVACTHLHVAILMRNGRIGVRRIDEEGREVQVLSLTAAPSDSEASQLLVTTSRTIYVVQTIQKTSEILKVFEDSEEAPKMVRIPFPWPVRILEASGGHDFLIFRDSSGNLFSMGTGTRGELGVGLIRRCDEPVHIEHLAGIRISKIACGGWHTVALTDGGDAYTWGWNRHGQLGKNKAATEMYPMLVVPSEDIEDSGLSPDDNVNDVEATESTTRIRIGSAHYVMGCDDVPVNEFAL